MTTATATKTRKSAQPKVVQIIARYELKRNGHVVYQVRSSGGTDTYTTTLVDGKASGCSCPAMKPCYHMMQLEAKEAARREAQETAAANVRMFYSEI